MPRIDKLEPGRWLVMDLECGIKKAFKRKANPFLIDENGDYANGIHYVGYRRYDEPENKALVQVERPGLGRRLPPGFLNDIDVLVGFNLCGYDLMFYWNDPEFLAFLTRGGRVHDCQYAEYLLRAQHPKFHMCSLNDVAPLYGGETKVDAVAACWNQGIDTPDIPKQLMLEYLIGHDLNSGDIGNTTKVYLGQVEKLNQLNMQNAWLLRMDGMLCTSQMMFNGVKVDMDVAEEQLKELTDELSAVNADLLNYLPDDLPDTIEWKWSSYQKSAMLFGGALKYKERGPVLDEDGNECYTKAKATAYLYGGRPVPLELMIPDRPGWFHSTKTGKDYECDKYLSGKRVGEYKTKQVDVRGELKTKLYDKVYTFPRMVEPLDEWATKNKDANGNPVYSTGEDTVEALERFEIPFIKKFVRYSALTKEITTYYRATGKNGEPTGMLTLVQPWDWIIHHNLHHTSTVTSRLSSSNPNLQNVPRKDKSKVKKLFVSRFGKDGFMIEADYSQLEVVGQGVLSKDENLRNDLRHKVDFHCKRVAARFGCTYEEAVAWCKNEDYEDYALWKGRRTDAKVFSFQRAYGAGARKISLTTGIPVQDVQAMIEAEEKMYPGVVRYNEMVARTVEKTARPFYDPDNGQTMRRGYYQAPTGTLYSFRSYPAPSYLKREGIMDSFMPTELKNYPVQGTSGEFVQAILGKLVRHFINNNNYGGKAFLVNTVHDCIWVDCHKDVLHEVGADVKRIMESIPELFNDVFDMGIDVPFPVEVEYGPNMYDLHHLQ